MTNPQQSAAQPLHQLRLHTVLTRAFVLIGLLGVAAALLAVVCAVQIVSGGQGVGRLIVAIIVGAVLCIIAIALGTIVLVRYFKRALIVPLGAIAEVAHAVRGDGQLDRRVPSTQIAEVNELADCFNTLLGQLEDWQGQAASTHQALLHRASYDPLSGLPNRTTFVERVRDAVRAAQRNDDRFAVLFMDGDDFKQTNDQYGHAAGDRVITEVAARISPLLRVGDLVARMGGDEFAILVHHLEKIEDAQSVATRVDEVMQQPINVTDHCQVTVGISIGIAIYPDDGSDVDTLIQVADDRMYVNKHARKAENDDP